MPSSITCPRPPRLIPGPPESVRYSLRQNTTGEIASVTSTGTLLTPLGNPVADSPSLPGRAPAPPEWKLSTVNGSASATSAGSHSTRPGPPKA